MLIFNELKYRSRIFYPVILLDRFIKPKTRKKLHKITTYFLISILFFVVIIPYLENPFINNIINESISSVLFDNIFIFRNILVILIALWTLDLMLQFFYLSHYFKKSEIDFEVANLVHNSNETDLTLSFVESEIGKFIMDKVGITKQQLNIFIKDERRKKVRASDLRFQYNARQVPNDDNYVINLSDYVKTIYDEDEFLQEFILRNNVSEDEFFGALNWVQSILWNIRNKERFWSKENLMRVPSLGRNWSIDNISYLNECSHLIYENKIYQGLGKDWKVFRDEAEMIESFLSDKTFNNIMMISENITIGMQVVSSFAKMISEGFCLKKFENKKIYIMNTDILISKSRNGDNLKENLLDILYVADKYPDVILVFPDFVGFVEKSYDFNLDVVEIFKDVLVNKKTPIIAITDKADFFTLIEPNFELMKYFDKYVVPKIDKDFIIRVLQREAHKIENKDKVNIIFPVINKIAEKHLNESDPIKSSLVELHKIYQ